MNSRKLGRGLDVLLQTTRRLTGDTVKPQSPPRASSERGGQPPGEETAAGGIRQIAVNAIQPNPFQPRMVFDNKDLETLKASISKEGVLQPVLVRELAGGYQLVAGERRFRAARELGLDTVPAIVAQVPDERMLELALVENLHREDLNPVDTGLAFQRLLELKGWTQEELAHNLGFSQSSVSNHLRILELPEVMQRTLARGHIQMGHAKVLLSIPNPLEQRQLFEKIAEDRLTVRELEIAREAKQSRAKGKGPIKATKKRRLRASGKDPDLLRVEEEMTHALGARVTIHQKKGRGVVQIEFYTQEDFDHLRGLLLATHSKP